MIFGEVGLAGNGLPARVRVIDRQNLGPVPAQIDMGCDQVLRVGIVARFALRVIAQRIEQTKPGRFSHRMPQHSSGASRTQCATIASMMSRGISQRRRR